MIYPPLDHPVWLIFSFVIGASIGSFLNVVIYRLPRNISVNNPRRSFCPKCNKEIPFTRNIPLITWLWLRGKCKDCKAPIPFRYFLVELLTGVLFVVAAWFVFGRVNLSALEWPQLSLLPLWFMMASFVAITFIDAEHQIIPLELTISGTIAGGIAAALMPTLPDLMGWKSIIPTWTDGLLQSLLGFVVGFFGLWAIVLLGKLAFGKMEWKHENAKEWRLQEPETEEDEIMFHMGDDSLPWWDIFFRKSDRLIIDTESLMVDGVNEEAGKLIIQEDRLTLPNGKEIKIEDLTSLNGTAKRAVVPREAMGMGDVHLMGMIGAFFGPIGVFFSLSAASMYAILAAVLGRIGFGVRLPFGPFLILGALTWWLGGWRLGEWYFSLLS